VPTLSFTEKFEVKQENPADFLSEPLLTERAVGSSGFVIFP
jgi:hypothetical protein